MKTTFAPVRAAMLGGTAIRSTLIGHVPANQRQMDRIMALFARMDALMTAPAQGSA